jgi:hypothetical protein
MKTLLIVVTIALFLGLGFYLRQRAQCATTLTAQQVAHLRTHYTREELTYFSQVAFGNDLGMLSPTIHRWNRPRVHVRIMSACDSAERHEVVRVLRDINQISRSTQFVLGAHPAPDLKLYLVPRQELKGLFHGHQGSANGSFGFQTSPYGEILSATVAVANNLSLPGWKEAIIREEIAQSIGLPRDTNRYAKSVFSSKRQIVIQDPDHSYEQFATEFLPIDQTLIDLLYNAGIPVNTDFVDFSTQVLPREGRR